MIPQSFPFVRTQKHQTQHYRLGPSSDEHRMVKPFLPLDSWIQGEEVSKSGKTNAKSPGTYNFRWLKRLDTIPWVFEAPGGIKSKA